MAKNSIKTDIAIIGAGPAGLTLAGLLAQQGWQVCLVDRAHPRDMAKPVADARTTALSYGTSRLLDRLGVWADLEPSGSPITHIDVQDGRAPVVLRFDEDAVREAAGADTPMGWIVENPDLRRVLWENVERYGAQCRVLAPFSLESYQAHDTGVTVDLKDAQNGVSQTIEARLLIGADGRMSRVRDLAGLDVVALDYRQIATVGLIAHDKPHNGLALERFYSDGPFAVLPFTDDMHGRHRSAVVWTRPLDARQRRLVRQRQLHEIDLTPPDLQQAIQARITPSYGMVEVLGRWDHYPLSLYHSTGLIADRVALVGDAAHAIHPIAGQGLNVGMQDMAVLADLLGPADAATDPGAPDVLADYQRQRRFNVFNMVAATDLLNRFFGMSSLPLKIIRPVGLGLVNAIPPLKNFFVKRAMGL